MTKIEELLKDKINITLEQEKRVDDIYDEISEFLVDELSQYEPDIFPQGSFKLGTIIRPPAKNEFDLDFVCLLNLSQFDIKQSELKRLLGDTLAKKYPPIRLEDKKRCTRVLFDNFHVDVLPAIPETDFMKYENVADTLKQRPLLIPDKNLNEWCSTNPLGYAEWFNGRKFLNNEKCRVENSIQPIPKQNQDSVLQKVVKLIKYHRDFMFLDDLDNKPISIIVTTLVATYYDGSQDVSQALANICQNIKMAAPQILETETILNPVNPNENFADAWKKHPERKENFRIWVERLDDLTNKYSHILDQNRNYDLSKLLLEHFGYATKLETKSPNITQPHIITNPSKQWFK